jgi:hypothetical protein
LPEGDEPFAGLGAEIIVADEAAIDDLLAVISIEPGTFVLSPPGADRTIASGRMVTVASAPSANPTDAVSGTRSMRSPCVTTLAS